MAFLLQLFGFINLTPLILKFIVGVREVYDRDARGCLQVDTGFDASDQPVDAEDTFVSTITSADGRWRARRWRAMRGTRRRFDLRRVEGVGGMVVLMYFDQTATQISISSIRMPCLLSLYIYIFYPCLLSFGAMPRGRQYMR